MLFPLKNCSNRGGFSGWLWIKGSNQFASWIHVRVSDLVYRTGNTVYSAEHLHETQNKIFNTEDINMKRKIESHATWIEFSFEMPGTTKFVLLRSVRKVENWNGELTLYL